MDVLCRQVLEQIKKTNKICEFYTEIISELGESSTSLELTDQNRNLNKPYYNNILMKLNKLHDLYESFNESAINDKLDPLMNCSNNMILFWKNNYTLNKQNIKKYRPTYESNCIVVHIDKSNELFYIYDTINSLKYDVHYKQLNELYKNVSSVELIEDKLPKLSQVFGIIIKRRFYRAVRENIVLTNNDKFYNAYLLDYGKIVQIKIGHTKIYKLPSNLENEPCLAICCKLDSIIFDDSKYGNRETFFRNGLHQKFFFQIESIDDNSDILSIKLIYKLNPFLNYISDNEYNWLDIKNNESNNYDEQENNNEIPYKYILSSSDDSTIESSTDSCSQIIPHKKMNKKKLENCYSFENKMNFLSIHNNDVDKSSNGLTKEENDMLMEEPLNTSNALYAILGYIPKDDKLICEYSKNGTCFKGSHCKLEHKQKISEGWTRDNAPTTIGINMKIIYPKNNSIIRISVTHIINVEYFFGQIQEENHLYDMTLREMTLKMNSNEEVIKYKEFSINSLPILFELILAKYTDGLYYRAKIIDIMGNYFKIFYVDYGNCETILLNDIRKWESKYECIPFQAVTFHLDGIRCIQNRIIEAEQYLRQTMINKMIKAKVINNSTNDIIVQVKLPNNCDLSKELVRLGYATKADNYVFSSKNNVHHLPG